MRITIHDGMGMQYTIDSFNPRLIGEWFAEKATDLMTTNSTYTTSMDIWPQTEDERKLCGHNGWTTRLNKDSLLQFAESILQVSANLKDET